MCSWAGPELTDTAWWEMTPRQNLGGDAREGLAGFDQIGILDLADGGATRKVDPLQWTDFEFGFNKLGLTRAQKRAKDTEVRGSTGRSH